MQLLKLTKIKEELQFLINLLLKTYQSLIDKYPMEGNTTDQAITNTLYM